MRTYSVSPDLGPNCLQRLLVENVCLSKPVFFCLFQMVTGLVVLFVAKQIKLVDFPGFSPDIFRRVRQLF